VVPLFPLFLRVAGVLRGPMRDAFSFGDVRAQFATLGIVAGLERLREPLGRAVLGWAVMLPLIFAVFYALAFMPARAFARQYGPAAKI